MDKESKADMHTNWYELWMKQSNIFFESAQKNLKNLFAQNTKLNPEDHLQQINQWLEIMKSQWELSQLSAEQKAYANYWKMMNKLYLDASELLVAQWIKRSRENQPVNNIRELYELWLNCCQEIHEKSLQSKTYQQSYAEMMNMAFKFWKKYMPQ